LNELHFETEKKETPSYETFISRTESLNDHLLWQLLMTSPSKEEEVAIGKGRGEEVKFES
jgi:hypothetical protein